ncbi:hypothetical protein B0H11DRAFT_1991402 [Mycena galericulata]|nr:hypothetical protein B0H11DRAFT_2015875 [Mycena galericulata]KAJ7501847.1 hypothetical protein B0H11DRAFT_1991402 [Mycena galericulata]
MSSAPPKSGPLAGSVIYGLEGVLITTAIQFWLHGLYTALVAIAVYNLVAHKTRMRARKGLLAATFLMFMCTNIQVLEQLSYNVMSLFSLGADPPDNKRTLLNMKLSENVFGRVNYVMSDAIVVWRAWVLYHDNLKVRLLLALCLLGSLAGATTDMSFLTLWLFGNTKFTPVGPRTLILILPLVVTNVVATSFMGYKVWQYRTHIKADLDLPKDRQTKVERILILLTESGTIYCLLWVPFLYLILTTQGTTTTAYNVTANIVPQLSTIYPVIIVLLVSLERTRLEMTVTGSTTGVIHFVSREGPGTGTRTDNLTNARSIRLQPEDSGDTHSNKESGSDLVATEEKKGAA